MDHVFGPLPRLHRMLVVVTGLIVGMVAGIWLVESTGVPVLAYAGLGWGLLAGLVLNYVLLHDFHRARPVRVRRH
jgi:hypothetical protein